jgi:hypothetical protein
MVENQHVSPVGFRSVLPEDVGQVSVIGPLGVPYLDPSDDPRTG